MRRDTAAEQKGKERSQFTFWLTVKWPEERRGEENEGGGGKGGNNEEGGKMLV